MPKGRSNHDDEEEHVNHEAWVIPYADMLTLLMGLFLVLWAIGNQDLAKMQQFAKSFSAEVGMSSPIEGGTGVLDGGSAERSAPAAEPLRSDPVTDPVSDAARAALRREAATDAATAAESEQLSHAEAVIRAEAAGVGMADAVSFRRETRGLVVSVVSDDVLFAPGSAQLRTDGSVAIDVLAGALEELPNRIAIEGHTDDVPISSSQFPSNWELATARAGVVLRYLVDRHGLEASRLQAGGYAEQRPLEPNTTPEGRARNRRVDVVVLSSIDTEGRP